METRPYVQWELMNDFMVDVFKAYGVPEEDAKICRSLTAGVSRVMVATVLSPFIWTGLKTAPCFL